MNNDQKINIIISAQNKAEKAISEAQKQISGFQKNTAGLTGVLKGVGRAATAAFAAVSAAVAYSVFQAAEAQQVQAQLRAVIASTGMAAGVTAEEALKLASSLEQVSTFSDEAIAKGETLILQFTNIGQNIFPQVTQAAVDVATRMGIDVVQAAENVGRALNQPADAARSLKALNIQLTDSETKLLNSLTATGRGAEAQQIILDKINQTYKGAALAAATTFGGALKILKNNLDDVAEAIGNSLLPVLTKNAQSINDTILKIKTWIDAHQGLVRAIIAATIVVTALIAVVAALAIAIIAANATAVALGLTLAALAGPIGWVVAGIAALGIGAGIAAYHMGGMSDATKQAQEAADKANAAIPEFNTNIADMGKKAEEAAKKMKGLVQDLTDLYNTQAENQANAEKDVAEAIVAQEQKVKDLKQQMADKKAEINKAGKNKESRDTKDALQDDYNTLQEEYNKEHIALQAHTANKEAVDAAYVEAKRRAAETDFERQLEDIKAKEAADAIAIAKRIEAKKQEILDLEKEESSYTASYIAESQKRTAQNAKEAQARISFAGLKSTSGIAGIMNTANSTPRFIPPRAAGGPVSANRPYWVGEQGPEMFVPSASGTILPHGASGSTINIYNPMLLDQSMIQKLSEEIARTLRQNFRY